ncbi:hypothetical protein GCM10022226_81420 [Sphaerisporangium flaviroseum]|uniref:YbaB/EbfC family DNA-binding protein n=1 Tax=Sphaerisporangium flaviroseum TaxID=509199 RepID=A0ABP7JIC4_9ACTN
MAPNVPGQLVWDPETLLMGCEAISSAARSIEVTTEMGHLSWRDPSVKQISSGGTLEFRPIDRPASHEEFIAQDVANSLHDLIPVLTNALKNLAQQAQFGSDGLRRMVQTQAAVEDANVAAVFGTIEKTLDRPEGQPS